MRIVKYITAIWLLLLPWLVLAETATELHDEVEDLKQSAVELNRDLRLLEEELLYPSSTRIAVFLSLDSGKYFALNSVKLKIDDKEITDHLYTERESRALARGGVQRLHIGNLRSGEHQLAAIFTGKDPNGHDYKHGTTVKITKGLGPRYVELKIIDKTGNTRPELVVREW